RKNKLKVALITTIDKVGTKKVDDIELNFLPSSVLCYTMGKTTVEINYLLVALRKLKSMFQHSSKT
ncbi:MAG TPA: hypothetical protein VK808_06730, partial [Bacteroidia bacterium]|nr:hypothetical protein [Bacteroidia bacterium]